MLTMPGDTNSRLELQMCNLFVTAQKQLYGMLKADTTNSSLTKQPSLSSYTCDIPHSLSSSLDKVDLPVKTGYNEYVLLRNTHLVPIQEPL
jgi:hypothetical protein